MPTTTSFIGPDPYDGVATCVSLNTGVAAKVGAHRITYGPNLSGGSNAAGPELRVDGVVRTVTPAGLNLSGGGRIAPGPSNNGIQIDFPDGTALIVSTWWWADQNLWVFNVDVFHTPASRGLMGALAPNSWLPALPNGTSVGPMPGAIADRYTVLYQKFGNAWRVSNATSLFDYKPGTSTATFTVPSWPLQSLPCTVPLGTHRPTKPGDPRIAKDACRDVDDKRANADCVFDVLLTGEPGLAKPFLLTQRIRNGGTQIRVSHDLGGSAQRRTVVFVAAVETLARSERPRLSGTVQFTVDGKPVGDRVKLNEKGQARWETSDLRFLDRTVGARFAPDDGSVLLPSTGALEAKQGSIE